MGDLFFALGSIWNICGLGSWDVWGIEEKRGCGVVKWLILVEVILLCLLYLLLHIHIEPNVLVVYFWEGSGVEGRILTEENTLCGGDL